ncbi:hypothetical protein LZK96_27945, partial [Pseudomonas aeruginosa]|nr:hypothetical protein [Pseudomonas aeruginosa]
IVRNEKRMLQEAVDALLDNGRRGRACAWLLFNSRAMQRYMELVYAQRLYRAQSANRPGSAQRRLANQAAYRERKRRERSGRS